jgi:hypothetical protein
LRQEWAEVKWMEYLSWDFALHFPIRVQRQTGLSPGLHKQTCNVQIRLIQIEQQELGAGPALQFQRCGVLDGKAITRF